jgi:hypothetical protein
LTRSSRMRAQNRTYFDAWRPSPRRTGNLNGEKRMSELSPFEAIKELTAVRLASQDRSTMRRFAGRGVRRRREMEMCRFIAEAIGPRYLWPLEFRNGDQLASEEDMISVVEEVMRSISAEDALHLASNDHRAKSGVRSKIGALVAKRLCKAYTVTKVDRREFMISPSMGYDRKKWSEQ